MTHRNFDVKTLLELNRESITFRVLPYSERFAVGQQIRLHLGWEVIKEITADEQHRQCRRSIDIDLHDPARPANISPNSLASRITHENGAHF